MRNLNHFKKQSVGIDIKFWSKNHSRILLVAYDIKYLFRYSFNARYKIFNTLTNKNTDVLLPNQFENDKIQSALLSNNGLHLSFVYQNDIYLIENLENIDKFEIKRLTKDGEDLKIYNGINDWLYEEEIAEKSQSMWWNERSDKLAYLKINDTNVNIYEFPVYDGSSYDFKTKIRYPKLNEIIPTAQVFVYDTKSESTIALEVPTLFREYYVWLVEWYSINELIVVYVNRKQTSSSTCLYNVNSEKINFSKTYPPHNSAHKSFWKIPGGLVSAPKSNSYLQIWHYNNYKSILSFNIKTGSPSNKIHHKFDITEIVRLNEDTGDIYYIATNGDPKQRHLYRSSLNDHSSHKCLTCFISLSNNNRCLYSKVHFSPNNGDKYVLECLGEDVPVVYVKSLTNDEFEYVLDANIQLRRALETRYLPTKQYLTIMLDESSNLTTEAELLLPLNFVPEPLEFQYPVLIYVYNGPSSQIVDYQFELRKFESYLCLNYNVVIAILDGRGTDGNGEHYMKSIYNRLGELETLDQFNLAKELKQQAYTDNDKFAIMGWSYGGFIAGMALFNQNSEFNCSISGAPVTDWSFYDSTYTERFMGPYHENRHKYEINSNLTNLALINKEYLENKKYLLIHGTGDDNVHFQNSANLAKALRKTKLDFTFEVYPDTHHTPEDYVQVDIYKKMTKFLLKCFHFERNNECTLN